MDVDARLARYLGREPRIHESVFVARSAEILGDVQIGPRSSVWYGCVLRADIAPIRIGEETNVQDGTIVHLADDLGVTLGDRVTVGHGALVHACTVEDECLVGMRATVLDGAVIGAQSVVGAGTLVTKGTRVPPGSLVLGVPGRVVRTLTPDERAANRGWAAKYVRVAAAHRRIFV